VKQKLTIVLILIASFTLTACVNDSGKEYDSRAIEALDSLVDVIGELNSCSYTLEIAQSELLGSSEWHTSISESDVYMHGPDKFYMHSVGDNFSRGFWYNGSEFAFYSFAKNTYDTIPVNGNIIEAIDQIHGKYGVDFPAADFFYPTLTDDIMAHFDQVYYVGEEVSGNTTQLMIEASSENEQLNIWIDKSTNLPSRFELFSGNNRNLYAAQFLNWKINPTIADSVFDFQPPSDSSRVSLTPEE
jgi:hypothetical protein